MMRTSLLLFLLNFCFTGLSFEDLMAIPDYTVVSDVVPGDVPKGKCRVKGQVFDNFSDVGGCTISNLTATHKTVTDTSGLYLFEIPAGDTAIFMHKEGYDGIMVWGYPFKEGHEVTINFYLNSQQVITFKPVIYAYSEDALTATIKITPRGHMSFTYPEMNDHWQVQVERSGALVCDDKTYPYLFWESVTPNLDFERGDKEVVGFLISSAQFGEEMDKHLTEIGLNFKERADLITFWGPKVCEKQFVFVQLWENDLYDQKVAEIDISPKPDQLKRFYFMFAQLDSWDDEISMKAPELTSFERNGFTVVEWGGSVVQLKNNIP